MTGRLAFLIATLFAGTAAHAQTPDEREVVIARWTSPTLTRFRSEAEFARYLHDLDVEYNDVAAPRPVPPPQPLPPPPPPPPPPSVSAVAVTRQSVLGNVTSSAPIVSITSADMSSRAPANPAITNVQEVGVDEGDIVKQVGQFLLVLQDGRIFSIDTQPGGRPGLALADRANVYRKADDDAWYDEMLVYGDRVVITGYSYDQEASQITVLRVAPDGRLRQEGTFFLSSGDYYDIDNYATRLVGDRLILYTPYQLGGGNRFSWPQLRRWRPGNRPLPARSLFDARAIHRPIADVEDPTIHTVSICRLGAPGAVHGLGCETSAFVGPTHSELYVTPRDAYLWVNGEVGRAARPRPCEAGVRPALTRIEPAFVYRVALADGGITVAGARGAPIDRMSLAVIGDNFHAMTWWDATSCAGSTEASALTFTTIPLARFGRQRSDQPADAFAPLPDIGTTALENRYTDTMLVYGGRPSWGSQPPAEPPAAPSRLVIVPVANPSAHATVTVPHGLLRVERVGPSDMVLTGYRDREGLQLSLVDLDGPPRIASTLLLGGRYESEGRSHAFNSLIGPDGGLMGVPTVPRQGDSGRWWWRSGASDLSFVAVDGAGQLSPAGDLLRGEGTGGGYSCEVSCVDWYGNSRPIFTGGRIFALTGTELIEGEYAGGRIREVRRLDVAAQSARRR